MRHVRGLRRAGVLLLAAMAVAGCSAGGGDGSAESQEEGPSSSSSDGGADGSAGSDEGADADGQDEAVAASQVEFSEDAATSAIEAVVPTSQVMGTDEIYAATEKTLAQFEEQDSTDTCMDLAKEQYELQLEARKPMVQGVVAEDAVLEPGATESVSVSATSASPELDELRERQNEDCLGESDELSTEESELGDCTAIEEEYIRPEVSGRRTIVLNCEGVTISYNSLSTEPMEGDVEEWNEQATDRVTEVLEQMAG